MPLYAACEEFSSCAATSIGGHQTDACYDDAVVVVRNRPKRAICGLGPAGGKNSTLSASASAAMRIRGDAARRFGGVCDRTLLIIDME
jgi:hypothetical protein